MPATPTVGLVIPNFNGERWLREAIDSALGQARPPEVVMVVDGGSTDGSMEVIRSFGSRLRFVSERDRGQADAIAKGFRALGTDLVGWLNGDDRLMPGALASVVEAAKARPDAVLFHGDAELVDEHGRLVGHARSVNLDYQRLRMGRGRVIQPGSFYRADAVRKVGGVDASWHLLMDLDLWIRLLTAGPSVRLAGPLGQFRIHRSAKSSAPPWRYYRESLRMGTVHESDRLLFATLRRTLGVVRHLALYSLRLSADRVRTVRPPRTPLNVRCAAGVGVPAELAEFRAAGVVVTDGPDPDVVIHSLATLAAAPRVWGPPTLLRHRGPLALNGALLDRPVTFALGDDVARAALSAAGLPACRIGRDDVPRDWARAFELAAGAWPGRVDG